MTPQQLIQKEIDEAIAHLNEIDEDGDEVFSYYRDELQQEEDKSVTIAKLIADADLDSFVTSPFFPDGEYGDVYVEEIKSSAKRIK